MRFLEGWPVFYSLRTRLTFAFILLLVIPFVTMVVVLTKVSDSVIGKSIEHSTGQTMDQYASYVNMVNAQLEDVANQVLSNDVTQQWVASQLDPNIPFEKRVSLNTELRKYLSSIALNHSAVASITVFSNNGTAVAVGLIDAHAAVPGVGATRPGQMTLVMGTSLCHMLLSDREAQVEGICGVVEDGIVSGLFGYEAGQPAVGDLFAWYVKEGVPGYVERQAAGEGVDVHAWLERRAAQREPGQHSLPALDWWNGNRSVLVDAGLSGVLVGLTLQTKPEDIYRALLEATAFGTRRIIDAFTTAGLKVDELFACGGLPQRNRLLMQIYADVTGREIKISATPQTSALGAAMFGAVAAGAERGGYDTIGQAAARMARVREETVRPIAANVAAYCCRSRNLTVEQPPTMT